MMGMGISKTIIIKNMKEMKSKPHKWMTKNKKILMKMKRKKKRV
jgi:hypothetical protein